MTNRIFLWLLAWPVCMALVLGCNVTESGNPPLDDVIDPDELEPPPPEAPSINTTVLTGAQAAMGEAWTLSGPAGAIDGTLTNGIVTAFALDSDVDPATGAIAADGSFTLDIPATMAGAAVRVQAESDEGRGAPVDVAFEADQVVPVESPLDDCVLVDGPADVVFPGKVTEQATVFIPVTNNCADLVVLGTPYPRRTIPNGPNAEGFLSAWNMLYEGNSVDIKIRMTPGQNAAVFNDVFIVPIIEPEGVIAFSVYADVAGW